MSEYELLALRYRPRTFQQVVGQGPARTILYHMVRAQRVPTALLFFGPRGSGKTTMARILGAALNCRGWDRAASQPQIPCRACTSCQAVEEGSSIDVLEVDAASNGGVAEIRRLKELTYYATPGDSRVVLLDEAHSMSPDAFNALLKVLEEPPPRTVFVLVTTEPSRIMPTVASRCMRFPFRRISPADITARLRHVAGQEQIEADEGLLALIAERSDGALRDAIMSLDQLACIGQVHTAAAYLALHGETDFAPALVSAAASGDHAELFTVLDKVIDQTGDYGTIGDAVVHCLRDMLVIQYNGTVAAAGESLAIRQRLAASIERGTVAEAMRVLWDLRTRARGADPRSTLELAMVMVAGRLCPAPPPATANGNGHAVLSRAEMRAMAGS